MSDLVTENANLKGEVEQLKQNANGLATQLHAHKQTIDELMQSLLNFRTNLMLVQKANQELNSKLQTAEKQVASLNQQLTDATAKLNPPA